MNLPVGAPSTRSAEEERVTAELGGRWKCWASGTHDQRVLWSAYPVGAESAVITGASSSADLVKRVRAYRAELPKRIEDARAAIATCSDTGWGRDQARVLRALVSALEDMQQALADQQ